VSAIGTSRRLRAYAYGAVTTVVVLLFALGEWWAEKYVADRSRLASTTIEIAIVLIATLAFRPLHQRVEAAVEAAFTKRRREAREAVARLRKELASFNDPQQVLRRVVEAVDHHMGATASAIYLLRRGTYTAEASSYDVPLASVEADDPLAIRLRSTAAPADPHALGSPAPGRIAFPMMAGGDLIGFLALATKHAEFEPEDRHALAGLAEAAGMAMAALDPRLRSQGATAPRNNLPRALTSFVGRDAEIVEIRDLLDRHALVTLVGSGGVGKTRTSLQVAANAAAGFVDGTWLVELAPLASGDYIPSTIARAVGLKLPATGEPLDNLIGALKNKHALLVFDNCEHLVEPSGHIIAAILAGCPGIKVLASSRQALDIAGEQAYRLPSLEVPESGTAELNAAAGMRSAAIALFVERAASVDKRFALTDQNVGVVAEICRQLDGIPLAIELAASKTVVLSPRQLSGKLDERFRLLAQTGTGRMPRQQTLHALIDWSFDLLDAAERAVFRRLSIFAGGWTLDAAQAACADAELDAWRVLELLSALVAKSLVVVDPSAADPRYRMLHSIREYSRERLEEAGETHAVAAKHARYYADLVHDLVPLAESLEDVQWRERLAPEIDNLRGALDWSIFRSNDRAVGLRLLAGIELPELLTTPHEAIRWFDAAHDLLDAPGDGLTKARVLRHRTHLEWLVGRPLALREATATRGLVAARETADPNEIARGLAHLGAIYRDANRFDEADAMFAEAYGSPDALSALTTNAVLRNWAVTDLQRGDLDLARRRFTEVAARERVGSEWHGSALLNLGELEFAAGNFAAAQAIARKARETFAHLNTAPLALALCNLAAYAMAVDDFEEARDCLADALRLLKASGARWMMNALEHHAVLGGLVGDHERACAIVGFTDARYVDGGSRQKTEQYGYERLMRALARAYDEAELGERLRAGARLSELQVLELAAAISQRIPQKRAAGAA
jgi:predicted ATPase